MTNSTDAKTANFVIGSNRAEIVLETSRNYVSFTGRFDGSAGQCQENFRRIDDKRLRVVLEAWDSLHLQPVPADGTDGARLLFKARDALTHLEGARIDPPEVEPFEDATFSNGDDVINSSDIISRIEYLTTYLEDIEGATPETYDPDEDEKGDRSKAVEELAILRALEDEGSSYAPDWEYGETLIRDSYFSEYAEDLVKDCGDIPRDLPNWIVIDWESTAENLKVDYTAIEFDGVTYWIR